MSSPKHIYLIDDEETFNFLNKTVLQIKFPDVSISIFNNGEDALDSLKSENPDLIFLDMYMPILNGWDFLEKASKYDVDLKVVMLTASIDPEEKKKALAYPFVLGVYSKPLTMEMIDEIVAKV